MKYFTYAAATTLVAVLVLIAKPSLVYGELIYEDDLKAAPAAAEPRVIQKPAAAVPLASEASDVTIKEVNERKELSKAEMLRRQRLREELKNEDLLTQKLEELRLQDEMKRQAQIFGKTQEVQEAKADAANKEVGLSPEPKDVIEAPKPVVNDSSDLQKSIIIKESPNASVIAPTTGEAVQKSESLVTQEPEKEVDYKYTFSVNPRGGVSNIINSGYDMQSKFAAGAGLGFNISEYIMVTGSYTFSQYKLGAGSTIYNPYNIPLQKLQMNDNSFDGTLRGYIFGSDFRVRPFVGGGMGYRFGYVNYDDRTLDYLKKYPNGTSTRDVEYSGVTGVAEGGLDVRISKYISLSAMFKYYHILSSRQTSEVNPYAFVNPNMNYGYYPANYGYNVDSRNAAADALSRNNYYQLVAGIMFSL